MIPISVAMQNHSLPATEPENETEEDEHDGNGEDNWWNEQQDGDHSE